MTSHTLFLNHSAPGSSLVKKKKIQEYFTKTLEPECNSYKSQIRLLSVSQNTASRITRPAYTHL